MRINKTATYLRSGYYQQFDEGSDLGGQTQDIESRLEQALFGNDDAEADDDAALDDDQSNDLPDGDDAEADDDAEVDDDGEQQSESEDDEQTIASILGVDDDKLSYDEEGNVVFNAIIDGKSQPVSMSDLVKSYQLEGHVNNKSVALENDRRDFEQTRDKAYGELTTRLTTANRLLEMAEQNLTAEFQSIDWNGLRYTDPAEWSAQRQAFSERLGQIEAAKNQIKQSQDQVNSEQSEQDIQKQQQFIQGEVNKMIADNPSWADQSVMAKEVGEIGSFLQSEYGFSPEEIANSMDSRLMRLIQDAHKFRSGKAAVKEKKIPDNVPKFRKPGQNNSKRAQTQKARQIKAQKAAIRKSGGSVDTIAASLIDRM